MRAVQLKCSSVCDKMQKGKGTSILEKGCGLARAMAGSVECDQTDGAEQASAEAGSRFIGGL